MSKKFSDVELLNQYFVNETLLEDQKSNNNILETYFGKFNDNNIDINFQYNDEIDTDRFGREI